MTMDNEYEENVAKALDEMTEKAEGNFVSEDIVKVIVRMMNEGSFLEQHKGSVMKTTFSPAEESPVFTTKIMIDGDGTLMGAVSLHVLIPEGFSVVKIEPAVDLPDKQYFISNPNMHNENLRFAIGYFSTLNGFKGGHLATVTFKLDLAAFTHASYNEVSDFNGDTMEMEFVDDVSFGEDIEDKFDPKTIKKDFLWHKTKVIE